MGPKKPRKPKKEPEVQDELTNMTYQDLMTQLQLEKDKYNEFKTKRNYVQMDRDMVEQLYQNTQKEIEECKIKLVNKETELEQQEEEHRVEVKVYLQKVKHLEYEQEKANIEIEKDGNEAKEKENQHFDSRIDEMKKEKMHLKEELTEEERKKISEVENQQKLNERLLQNLKQDFDKKLQLLTEKYEQRLQKLKEDLQLKLKVEIHELEERKNLHINELMKNHDKAFAELKKFYNDITSENLNLIKQQKEEISKIHGKIQSNSKQLADMKENNNKLKDPLQKAKEERDRMKILLKQFTKHKMSLQNLKSKLITIKEKIMKLENDSKDLDIKYDKVVKEKKYLTEKFQSIVKEVSDNASYQNIKLNEELQSLQSQFDAKETQLKIALEQANLDPQLHQQLVLKIQSSIEQKNTLIKNLKYSIHHATKAYNDAIRVYEAKLIEFGIPAEELGFQTLETLTSTMPAGLVSS